MIDVESSLKGRDFLRIADWAGGELVACLDLADRLKEVQRRREEHRLLPGRTLGMIFQKPSTRTRVSFEVGIAELGRGEPIRDTGLVLSRYLDAIMSSNACPRTRVRRSQPTRSTARSRPSGDQAENRLHAQKALMTLVVP